MKGRALILAAHGSRHEQDTAALIQTHAQHIRQLNLFEEVAVAFHHGRPGFAEVLDQLGSEDITVVPVMTSRGYYSETVLPGGLSGNRRYCEVNLRQTAPVGMHPGIVDLITQRIADLVHDHGLEWSSTAVVVVGHGTTRHPRSREATISLVTRLRSRCKLDDVAAAFLDEEPSVAEALAALRAESFIVIPFLIGQGQHVTRDVPLQLGMTRTDLLRFPLRERVRGAWVVCDAAVGTYPGLADLIIDLADPVRNRIGHHSPSRRPTLRLGTRASRLARWQANFVAQMLQARGAEIEIITMSTPGDRDQTRAIAELAGDAPFTDEISEALLHGHIDLAVHSLKDLPLRGPDELTLAAILPRGPASESLVARGHLHLNQLARGAVVGTSSARRVAQMLALRPDLKPATLRGSVEDRVQRVVSGQLDAAILATAGLQRLGLMQHISETFSAHEMMPAPGQGAIAVQVRRDSADAVAMCAELDNHRTRRAVETELEFLRAFEADPAWQAAALAECDGRIKLRARLVTNDGGEVFDFETLGHDPQQAARRAVKKAREAIRSIAVEEPVGSVRPQPGGG